MARVVVFDSGLGSLSIIKALQNSCKLEIVYFADQKNFPYGKKSKTKLEKIIKNSIKILDDKFNPELIVVGSNTPTIVLEVEDQRIIGVNPPIKQAVKKSKTKNIGILGTKSLVNSKNLTKHIENCGLSGEIVIHRINASNLVQLVESGRFLTDKNGSRKLIRNSLSSILFKNKIDVLTLSSTHLPFLRSLLESEFPKVSFIDPADELAKKICKKIKTKRKNNLLRIFSSDQTGIFKKNLEKMGIKKKIEFLSIGV